MAGGIYDSQNFEEKKSKWSEVKILFALIYSSQNVLKLYLLKGL
jgi:hypothetical protein